MSRIPPRRERWAPFLLACVLASGVACSRASKPTAAASNRAAAARAGAVHSPTSREDLAHTVAAMDTRLRAKPTDTLAAVTLADALMRQTRVTGNAGLAMRGEAALKAVLDARADDYEARRMLATVYLSEHRFRDAIGEAERCQSVRPQDAAPFGAAGDAHLELGEYDAAFSAFDRMAGLRPNAASYDRASYARELQGDLPGALRLMTMAAEATSAEDPEAQAWHYAQLGHLELERGHLDEAARAYAHAAYVFPDHPFALEGQARVASARGDYATALMLANTLLSTTPMPSTLAFRGDLHRVLGQTDEADRDYRLAEAAWRTDAPEPARLARFLAERGANVTEAVRMAEAAWRERHDIFTADALAWARFRAHDLTGASSAIAQALRTGSRDRTIRYHAAAIAFAAGDVDRAAQFAGEAVSGLPTFDPIDGPTAVTLARTIADRRRSHP